MRTLDQIKLKPNEREAIRAAAATLRENLPVNQVILFGSKARGDDQPDSDVDLLVLTRRPLNWEEQEQAVSLLSPVQEQYDVIFGIIYVDQEEWYHGIYQAMPLRTEVDRDGILT